MLVVGRHSRRRSRRAVRLEALAVDRPVSRVVVHDEGRRLRRLRRDPLGGIPETLLQLLLLVVVALLLVLRGRERAAGRLETWLLSVHVGHQLGTLQEEDKRSMN